MAYVGGLFQLPRCPAATPVRIIRRGRFYPIVDDGAFRGRIHADFLQSIVEYLVAVVIK
ncbi:MAG: hypothetical protein ABIR47_09305 [Candidatus Kapaibacterium sp.]